MTTTQIALLVVAVVAVDGLVLFGFRTWIGGMFEGLARAYPLQRVSREARRERGQSIQLSGANFGRCFEITLDEQFAHFTPSRVAQWFGAAAFSVPRASLSNSEGGLRRLRKVKLGKWRLAAPEWVFTTSPHLSPGPQ